MAAIGMTAQRKRKHMGFFWEIRKNWVLFLMLAPTLIFFIVNSYFPMAGIYWAFTKWSYTNLFGGEFVGLKNFAFLISSRLIISLTVKTVLYNIAFIVIGNAAQIFVAILLHEMVGKFFKKFAQTVMFFPYFVSYVIMSVIVYNLFNYEKGLVNNVLISMGLKAVNLYNMPGIWPFFIILFYLWKWVGYGTVIYLATILGISREYYEAAQIDGANVFQQIRHITLPNIKPTFIILLLFALGGIMRGQFEMFWQIVGLNGTLYPTTDIIDMYVYRSLITNPDIPMVTAAGVFQSIIGFVLVMTINFLVKRRNPEYALF